MYARTDLASYHQGLVTCRNFFVDYRSGISSRSGTKFVIQSLKSSTPVRLIGFSVSVTTTYVIEFGDKYCRFINNGAPVLEAPFSVSSITRSTAAQAVVPGNNFAAGDWIFLIGTNGMPQANGRYLQVGSSSGGVVTLLTTNGAIPLDTSAFGAYTGGATASRVYTIASPYAAADLALIKFVESVSVLYITHPSYPPETLTFAGPTNWFFTQIQFGTTIASPTGLALSSTPVPGSYTGPLANFSYVVTAVDSNGQESLASTPAYIDNVVPISVTTGTITLTWAAVTGAIGYNIYKSSWNFQPTTQVPAGVAYGFVGLTNGNAGTSFIDSNISPDFSTTPPVTNNMPFANGNNPGCVVFFQQRAWYASTNTQQATFWGSQPGAFNNFNTSDPIQADDEITGTIVSTQLNSIQSMLPMPGGLIMLTGRAAFTLNTGQGTNATLAVTPSNATIVPQAYNGASSVPPIVVNEDILYVQAKGSIVRDLAYNIYAAIYTGTDISIKSNHLFYRKQILQWAYSEEPFKIVWAIRNDGVALSLTFMKEQQISGWARHDTQGLYQSVTAVQEGAVDATYFVVQRFVNGNFVQFIERQMERQFDYGIEDAWCMDCGIQSSLPTPNATITISGASGTVTVLASAAVFSLASVGQVLRADFGIFLVTAFVSPTQVTATVSQTPTLVIPDISPPVPVPVAAGSWSIAKPATQFWGLDYLIGQSVSILADGGVVAPQVVAADGSITLASPATKVTAGLGFQCQGKTMPLDLGEPSIQGKRKKIGALNFKLADSRGLKAGRTFSTLVSMKDMNISVPIGTPIPLISGDTRVVVDPLWDVPGQVCFQIDDPVPASILGIIPEYVVGDK